MEPTPRLFCFGLGYTAERLAAALGREGWRLAGTCREQARQTALAAQGIESFLFDRGRPLFDPAVALAGTTHLLSSVPPDGDGEAVLDMHGEAIAAAAPHLVWAGYLSTTGVYGNLDGEWVDESSPLRPSGARGERRVAAEARWLALGRERGLPIHVFRLAGIYGPGRNYFEALRAGKARRVVKPGQVFSRIHVDDIVAVLRASMARPNPGAVYNVADDEPAAPDQVILHAARLLDLPAPPALPFEDAQLSEMARSFYADSKRVRNERIKRELGVRLSFPNYRVGLAALLTAGG